MKETQSGVIVAREETHEHGRQDQFQNTWRVILKTLERLRQATMDTTGGLRTAL